MRIFEIILFEYILGYVLQGFAVCLGIYAFCVKKVEMRKYVAVSLILECYDKSAVEKHPQMR